MGLVVTPCGINCYSEMFCHYLACILTTTPLLHTSPTIWASASGLPLVSITHWQFGRFGHPLCLVGIRLLVGHCLRSAIYWRESSVPAPRPHRRFPHWFRVISLLCPVSPPPQRRHASFTEWYDRQGTEWAWLRTYQSNRSRRLPQAVAASHNNSGLSMGLSQ